MRASTTWGVEAFPATFAPLPQALIYIRGSAPTGFGMLPQNDGSIYIRFLTKMQELKWAKMSLNELNWA